MNTTTSMDTGVSAGSPVFSTNGAADSNGSNGAVQTAEGSNSAQDTLQEQAAEHTAPATEAQESNTPETDNSETSDTEAKQEAAAADAANADIKADADSDTAALSDEEMAAELEKIANDPTTPQFARTKIKEAMTWAGRANERAAQAEAQAKELQTQYEGKETLDGKEIERLREVEDKFFNITSFTAEPGVILETLKEVVPQQKIAEVQNNLVWDYLETSDGQPNLNNLQVVIDRFTGATDASNRVNASDVLLAAKALQNGTIEPYQLHDFQSDAEYEAFQKAEEMKRDAERHRETQQSHARFQEEQARATVLTGVHQTIQGQIQPQVQQVLAKLHLLPQANEPQIAAKFKTDLTQQIEQVFVAHASKNRSLMEVQKALEILGKPRGVTPDVVKAEIGQYTSSPQYQAQLNKGLAEVIREVEKFAGEQAYRYKLMMLGYEAENGKGHKAREVVGKANQAKGNKSLSADDLKRLSAAEKIDYSLRRSSEAFRARSAR